MHPIADAKTSVTSHARRSWRDEMPIHPAAELLPLMTDAELVELGEDIKANGLKNAVAIYADPGGALSLLDGRNRLDGMERVGMPFALSGPGLDAMVKIGAAKIVRDIDPYAYVISANIQRRHLNVEQRRELITKLLERMPDKSSRTIAKMIGVSPQTVSTARQQAEDVSKIGHVATRTDSKGRQQPAHKSRKAKPKPKPDQNKPDDVQASADARKAAAACEEAQVDQAKPQAATLLIEVQCACVLLKQKPTWPLLSNGRERDRDRLMCILVETIAKLREILNHTIKQQTTAPAPGDPGPLPEFLRREAVS
jgi:hypothetical protein